MASKFNPDDLKNPVYEYSQVVTVHDLRSIYSNLAKEHKLAHWYEVRRKLNLLMAGHVIYELLTWLADGKPSLKK